MPWASTSPILEPDLLMFCSATRIRLPLHHLKKVAVLKNIRVSTERQLVGTCQGRQVWIQSIHTLKLQTVHGARDEKAKYVIKRNDVQFRVRL
jgi:hypothetical protein